MKKLSGRQRSAAVAQQEFHPGVLQQMTGEQQARYGDRRIDEPAHRIDEIVIGKPRFAAYEHRMHDDGGAEFRSGRPEGIK